MKFLLKLKFVLQICLPHIHRSKITIDALKGITNKPIIRSDIDKLNINVFDILKKKLTNSYYFLF
jgi:GMP synthase PP-ATPase subunit